MNFSQNLIRLQGPDRRPRRVAYILPSLFTAANVLLGFLSILQSFEAAMKTNSGDIAGAGAAFRLAALMIGAAVFADGLDGRIARMTNTVSDFGRELDSLADVITFGVAPAVLAFAWGVHFTPIPEDVMFHENFLNAGYFATFIYVICCAARLARFNVQTNPVPKNPGRPDRKYFVGLPTPPAAALVASVVYAGDWRALSWWVPSICWIGLLMLLGFLMVSTWRYRSFKDLNLLNPRSFKAVIGIGSLIFLIVKYSQPVLLALSLAYASSGVLVRMGGVIRRALRRPSTTPEPERQVG